MKSYSILFFLFIFNFYFTGKAADRFWIGGSGSWSNNANWSLISGGAGGASVPTSADDVYFDTNSFNSASLVVTIDANASCNNMYWTTATNNPSITGAAAFSLTVAGTDFFLIDAMTYSVSGQHNFTNTASLTLNFSNTAHNFGDIDFSGTSTRTIDINGNGAFTIGRITVGNNSTFNFNGTGAKTINGYFSGIDVITDFNGDITFSDTVQTGYDNAFSTDAASINSFQTFLVGEVDDGSRNYRIQGTNTYNGEVITADDYQNTDRLHFYNSVFNDKVTITAPDGRAQFRSNAVFNDTLLMEANTSVRCYDVDTFNSVVICVDDNFLYLSQNNSANDYTVFNDSVFLGSDMDFRSYRNATFNGPVNFVGNDNNSSVRRFNDGAGTTTFNDRVWFGNGVGSATSRWVFERQTEFNHDVFIGNNTYLHFNDGNSSTNFNDNLTIGNSNNIYFERNVACDSLTIIGNLNIIQSDNTNDFDELLVGDQNELSFLRNVDFNDNAIFGDTNIVEFGEFGGEVDVFDNLTFGSANIITFNRRVDFGPASPGDSLYLGTLSTAEFNLISANNYFEDFILDNESRASFRNGTNRFDNIVINDFSTIELSAGGLNTVVGDFIANETCTTPPIVRSGTGGERAIIDFTNTAPTWSNVIVQDLEVTSSNILTIDAAVNNGNLDSLDDTTPNPGPPVAGATIWITNDRAGTTLYWIGSSSSGAGINWSDASNWSTSSGGAASICIPTPKDNVVFDANSFNASGEQVLIDASFVICNDMTWTGVTAGAQLSGNNTNTIFITGNLVMDANMVNNFFGTFEFNANDGSVRTIDPNGVDFEGALTFNYLGGNWEFSEHISAGGTVAIADGTVNATSNNYNLTTVGADSDFDLSRSGTFLGHDNDITIGGSISLMDSSSIQKGDGQISATGDLDMIDTAIMSISDVNVTIGGNATLTDDVLYSHDAGQLDITSAFTSSNDVIIQLDTIDITIGGNWTMNNDVQLFIDSCSVVIGGAMNANNDVIEVLGGSDITINGGDFYVQDDASATMKNGAITVNGDQFYLDDDAQFIDTGSVIIADNDFVMQNNTVFSSIGGSIEVQSDDFFLDQSSNFSLTDGSITVLGDEFYLDDDAQATLDNCTISSNDNVIIENNSVLTCTNGCVFDIEDNLDMNNSATFNPNDALIYVGANVDFETSCTFNEGTSTIIMDDDHNDIYFRTRGENLYNVIINKEDSSDDVRIINNGFIIRNNLHVLRGELWDSNEGSDGPYQITGNTTGTGTIIVTSKGTIRIGDTDGGSDAPTTFPTGWANGDISLQDSSTIYYRQRLLGTPQIVSSIPTYSNLTLNNSNGPLFSKTADGVVTINGRFFIDDNVQFADSGFQIVGNANTWTEFEMDNGSVLTLGSASSATTLPSFLSRDWDQRSTIDYAAGVAQSIVSISGGGNANSYGHLTLNNLDPSPSLVDKTMAGVITVRRQLNINSYANMVDAGFQITGNNTGDDLTIQANAQLTLGTAASNTLFPTSYTNGNIDCNLNSLVVYNSDLDQDISNNPSYGNMQLSSTSTVIKSLTGNTDIDGTLTIDLLNSLTTTASNYDIDIEGDWINNGTFSANTSSTTFNGSSLSTILGNTETDFYDLIINNSATDSAIRIESNTHVTNSLTLTNGIVTTNSGDLYIYDNATASSGSDNSYIHGPLFKIGNDNFEFPVGDEGKWARIGISNLQNSPTVNDTMVAQYFRDLHPEAFWNDIDYAGNTGGLENTSIVEYWELNRVFGSVQPLVSLYWSDNTESYITDTSDITVAHYTGGNTWVNEGGSAFGSLASGYVRSISNITSFSPFTFGSTTDLANPLPIELLNFTAKVVERNVELDWTTESEINNDFYSVQRSKNTKDFKTIGEVTGAGTSQSRQKYSFIDHEPFEGISYYRLKQTDFDGKFSYSPIRVVELSNSLKSLKLFPNPVKKGEQINFNQVTAGKITTLIGVEIMTVGLTNSVDLSGLESGIYFYMPVEGRPIQFVIE